jgi:hypothetical protein
MLIDEQPLICGMCGRRLCDITAIDGHVALLYALGNGRGPLDRIVSEATLHKLYTDAMTSNAREVVLR